MKFKVEFAVCGDLVLEADNLYDAKKKVYTMPKEELMKYIDWSSLVFQSCGREGVSVCQA